MSSRIAFLGLALLATALLAVIVLELDGGQPVEDGTGIVPIRHLPKTQPRAASEDPEDHTDAWVATALERPLFSRDRRPTPVEAKAGGPVASTTLPRLTGVIVGPFGRTAIFAGTDGGKPLSVGEGKTIGPYTIEAIAPGGVTVTGPEGERNVTLAADANSRSTLAADIPQPPPQPQPPGIPGVPPGALPGAGIPGQAFTPQQRQNLLNLRAGALQRSMQGIQPPQPNREGSD